VIKLKNQIELDFANGKSVWIKAEVAWPKSDIVPGVLLISERKNRAKTLGYYYMESKRLAKSCTHTTPLTQEELDKELAEEIKWKNYFENQNKQIETLQNNLPYLVEEQYKMHVNYSGLGGRNGFFDMRKFYQSLKIYPNEITKELIKENLPADKLESYKLDDLNKEQYPLVATLIFDKEDWDGFWTNNSKEISDGKIILTSEMVADAFFNIKIFGGTWGKIIMCNSQEGNKEIQMDLIQEVDQTYLTFPDINIHNPLFKSFGGSSIRIETDGKSYSICQMILNTEPRRLMVKLGNSYAVSWFESKNKVLLLGHMWRQSNIYPIDKLCLAEFVDTSKQQKQVHIP